MKINIDQNLKNELINQLMITKYKDQPEQRLYLETLCEEKLDKMLTSYYLYDIKIINKYK